MAGGGFGGGCLGWTVIVSIVGLILVGLAGGGVLIIYLGYLLILKGTSGGFSFTSNMKGWELGLASTSPGLFVVLCGTLICLLIAWKALRLAGEELRGPNERGRENILEKTLEATIQQRAQQPRRNQEAGRASPVELPNTSIGDANAAATDSGELAPQETH